MFYEAVKCLRTYFYFVERFGYVAAVNRVICLSAAFCV